jgi:hypothetical protein
MFIVSSLLQLGVTRAHVIYMIWALLGLLVMRSSFAAVNPPNPMDLTQGSWEVDMAKAKYCGGQSQGQAAPKVSRRHIYDAGFGLIVVHWTGTQANGKPFDVRYVYRYDGEKYPASIDEPDANESIVWKLVDPHHVEFTHYSKDNKITQQLSRTVSDDGQTMTQTTRYTDRPGCEEVQVFNRIANPVRPRMIGGVARPHAMPAGAAQAPR